MYIKIILIIFVIFGILLVTVYKMVLPIIEDCIKENPEILNVCKNTSNIIPDTFILCFNNKINKIKTDDNNSLNKFKFIFPLVVKIINMSPLKYIANIACSFDSKNGIDIGTELDKVLPGIPLKQLYAKFIKDTNFDSNLNYNNIIGEEAEVEEDKYVNNNNDDYKKQISDLIDDPNELIKILNTGDVSKVPLNKLNMFDSFLDSPWASTFLDQIGTVSRPLNKENFSLSDDIIRLNLNINNNNNNNNKVDFLTLVFDNNIEINLLKLQAYSFSFVDFNLINNIIIFYNDSGLNIIDDLKDYYPSQLKEKVHIIYRDELFYNKSESAPWKHQQLYKLILYRFINSKYYIVLDCKNHFIRNVSFNNFFKNNKPILFTKTHKNNKNMMKYFYNSLKYFDIKDPKIYKLNLKTVTPFIFITEEVKNMIDYIEKKEKTIFSYFFLKNNDITEFYLYQSYIIFKNKLDHLYTLSPQITKSTFKNSTNIISDINEIVNNNKLKIFGLHRNNINNISDKDKEYILKQYFEFYNNNTIEFIKNFIFYFKKID